MVKYLPRQEVRDSRQLGAISADRRTWVKLHKIKERGRTEQRCRIAQTVGSRAISYSSERRELLLTRKMFPSIITATFWEMLTVHVLRSGICTRNNFLHSFGFVMCAGMNGYCEVHPIQVGHVMRDA